MSSFFSGRSLGAWLLVLVIILSIVFSLYFSTDGYRNLTAKPTNSYK